MKEIPLQISNKRNNTLPSLSEHPILRYFSFAILYVAQGIPEGMIIYGIPAWMAMNNKTPAEIGTFGAIIFIPFSFKILVAPLIERFTFLPMGRRRPWIIFGQLGLVASLIALSMVPDPLNNIKWLTAVAFCVTIFITFQDIATDALVIDIVPMNQQSRANGFMWGSKIIGTAASLAVGTWLLNNYGFFVSILCLSFAVCFIMLVPLLFRERSGERLLPWTSGTTSADTASLLLDSWTKIFKSLFSVLKLPNSLLLALVLFFTLTAMGFMRSLFPIFTIQELGWSNKNYSEIYAVTSLVGGILGMLVGGFLLEKFGKIKMLSVYLVLLILFTISMAFSRPWWNNSFFTTGYITLFNFLFVFIAIGIFATAMQCCWKKVSALQFTLYMAIYNLGQTAGSALIGPVRNNFSWEYTFLLFSAIVVIALVLIRFLHIKNHLLQLGRLENN